MTDPSKLNEYLIHYNSSGYVPTNVNGSLYCIHDLNVLHWWATTIGSVVICIVGIVANLFCFYSFKTVKYLKKSSYVYYLRLLSLADSLCLFMELTEAMNELISGHDHFYKHSKTMVKTIRFFTDSFQLNSAWIICAFSIQRCISINSPLVVRKFLSVTKKRINCFVIFIATMAIQITGLFLPKCFQIEKNRSTLVVFMFHQYFNQITCLVLIPTLIIVPCNSLVLIRIIQRRRMLNSGNFHNFKINKSRTNLTQVKASKCNSSQPIVSVVKISKNPNNLNEIVKFDAESNNSAYTTEDVYSTYDDSRSLDSGIQISLVKHKNNKRYILRAKLHRDVKIFLLMIFSTSFLIFVLPEALLKFLRYQSIIYFKQTTKINKLLIIFHFLKLIYYSSNFLAYLTLVTFTNNKTKKFKLKKNLVN